MSPKLLAALCSSHMKVRKDAAGTKSGRALKQSNSAEEALDLARKKLPEASDTQIKLLELEGQTMQTEIMVERRAAKARGGRIPCTFWKQLKARYGIEEVTSVLVLSKDEKEKMPINPALVTAIKTFRNKNTSKQSKEALSSYLRTCKEMNKRELHGLIKVMINVRTSTEKMRELWLAFMGAAVRLEWAQQDKFLEELSLLHDSMDEVLVQLWAQYRAEDQISVFVTCFVLCFVLLKLRFLFFYVCFDGLCVCMYLCMYVCMYVYIYIYMFIYLYIYIYIYIYFFV